ncbi:MAG: glycosyl hydrolase family 18 protein, partial [Oscillospiraceae bacterium]|nr:glycosyl hydrolase family 18 protein [Oscillospiraceae bacterium]
AVGLSAEIPPEAAIQRRIIGYFCEWRDNATGQNYTVHDIPWGKVTHINYAFAQVTNNRIALFDPWFAIQKEYHGQDPNLPFRGHFNLLNTYKRQYPDTKLLISVGGWTLSSGFYTMTDSLASINTFADSCVEFLRTYNFDGIDIDFEYPTATSGAGDPKDNHLAEPRRAVLFDNFVTMMRVLREKLDEAGRKDGKDYLLTFAAPASSWILGGMQLGEYAQYLDFVNIMTYDFHGTWNNHVGPHAALLPDSRDTETLQSAMPVLNTDWARRYFRGVLPPEKINIGVPFYTRGWTNVEGGLSGGLWGRSSQGAGGNHGIWNDPGTAGGVNPLWHIKNLLNDPNAGFQYFWDDVSKTPYVWHAASRTFITHEDERSVRERANYVIDHNLGGFIIWELGGDFSRNPSTGLYGKGDTLVTLMSEVFKAAEPLRITQPYNPPSSQKANFSFNFGGTYSHPNYNYTITITNNTGQNLSGFTMQFDFPKSSVFNIPSGTTLVSKTDIGDFDRFVIRVPDSYSVLNGGSNTLTGMAVLPFSGGIQNVKINGSYSFKEFENVREISIRSPTTPTTPTIPQTPTPPTTPQMPSTPSTPTTPPSTSSGSWDSDAVYHSGDTVTFNGVTYRAKWWTQGERPDLSGEWDVWERIS